MKRIKHLLIVLVLIGFDQWTKYLAKIKFADGDSFTILPKVLKFIYHENDGAVWGIMSGKIPFLAIVTVIALLVLGYLYFKIPDTKRFIPLTYVTLFIVAGAIGNFIDRVIFGFVTDFIYFELIDFPVFNVADIYITVSVFVFAVLTLFYYKEEEFDCFKLNRKDK